MSHHTIQIDERMARYLVAQANEPEVLSRLREETAELPLARMQICPEQGKFMRVLLELTGAERAIEVGTFTGYSALCMALAMGPKGKVVACDVSEEWTSMARRYWADAGVEDKIELRLSPAVQTLAALLRDGAAGTFDFAFIDADKENYVEYYSSCLELLRPGGVVAMDNALWGGAVADPAVCDAETSAIRALNERVRTDPRVASSLVPIGDGLLIARKR